MKQALHPQIGHCPRLHLLWHVGAVLLAGVFWLSASGCDSPPSVEVVVVDSGCQSCHSGIEHMHAPLEKGRCVTCHGGDGAARQQDQAHVAVPDEWKEIRGSGLPSAPYGFIKDFSADQLSKIDKKYLQFINPSDLRVVSETCGECHPDEVSRSATSVMATNTGHYFPSLFLAGSQKDRQAHYGAQDISVDKCPEPGTSCELVPLRSPGKEFISEAIEVLERQDDASKLEDVALKHYLAKSCNACHQSAYPSNDSPGLFRSTGCASCHVVYAEDGLYEGDDETLDRHSPVHPKKHEITSAIVSEQCASCHFQGGRIGLLFRGIREGGFADQPEFARTIDRPLYGHPPGFYIDDEDTRNDIDETPPDVHYQLGMHCADCHVGTDVHGDGLLHASSKTQVDLSCEDCHGDVRGGIAPDDSGVFRTKSGRALPQLSLDELGQIILTGIVDKKAHPVPQPAELLKALPDSHPMHAAMAPDASGWSHADSLTCDTCHTSYNQQCVGCHVTYDLRLDSLDQQTGQKTPGVAISQRGFTTLSQVLLGRRADGRIQSVVASEQLQLSVVGSAEFGGEGKLLVGEVAGEDGWPRGRFRGRDERPHLGFAPFFQHTVSSRARGCTSCHRKDDSDEERQRVRGVYGYGTGEFNLPGESGANVDPFKFLNENGEQMTPWQQPDTGPVSQASRARALGVVLSE